MLVECWVGCLPYEGLECWLFGYFLLVLASWDLERDPIHSMFAAVGLHASHRHGLHMTHGILLEEHLEGIGVAHKSVSLVDGSDIRGVELDRGSGGLRGSVDSRGGLVLLGRGGSVDLEESHVCSCGWVGWVGLGESVCTSA